MDITERLFKVCIDIMLTAMLFLIFSKWFSWTLALTFGFFFAHTMNFLLNGHLWGALKQYGLVHTPRTYFDDYERELANRARRESSIQHLYTYGSLARQEWSPSSDLDLRLVRYPGFINGLRACCFAFLERCRALFARFPIDIYVIDRCEKLNDLYRDERGKELL